MESYFDIVERIIPAAHPTMRLAATFYRTRRDLSNSSSTPECTLLITNGNGYHQHLWRPTLIRLAQHGFRGQCVTFDFRNQGDSALLNADTLKPGTVKSYWTDNVKDTKEVVTFLNTNGALIGVGHSMGGCCLIATEQDLPNTFQSIIALDPIIFSRHGTKEENDALLKLTVTHVMKKKPNWPSRELAHATLSKKVLHRTWHPEVMETFVNHSFYADEINGGFSLKCTPREEANTFEGNDVSEGVKDRLGEVKIPVYFICGMQSLFISPKMALGNAQGIENSELILLPNVGHAVPYEAVERTALELYRITRELLVRFPTTYDVEEFTAKL